ncbi:MAG: diguanylate cyclase [Halofilum sp. (in: g-proteobacteria)]
MNILVVDHSKVFRAMWRRMASAAGHEPIMVTDGGQGLDTLRNRAVDLVCVALSLSDMTGIEFCRQARAMRGVGRIPILLLTSSADKSIRHEAFEAGISDIHPRTDVEHLFRHAQQFLQGAIRTCSGRVLYVEDSNTVAAVMLRVLGEMNLEVDHYASASEACDVFDPERYDLVISDILVDGEMSGTGLVRSIRAECPDHMRTPILAVSGIEDKDRRIELFHLGINDFISKPVLDEEVRARVTHLITNRQLIEQVEDQRRYLYELAMTDQLTGLYNRNSLAEFAGRALAEAKRHEFPLSVVLIDIDHFKAINDTHGHLVGDEVLSAIGELLLENTRTEDFAVRFGGEELLLILTHGDLEDAAMHAERIRTRIEDLHPCGLDITASLGIAARPRGKTVEFEQLLRAADEAVYEAKDNGRNRVATAREAVRAN